MALNRTYHRLDGWRGYFIPARALVGASDTGHFSDSPCPSHAVKAELRLFRREVLKPLGVRAALRWGGSSNVFCGKRWLVLDKADAHRWSEVEAAARAWLEANNARTHYIHDAA